MMSDALTGDAILPGRGNPYDGTGSLFSLIARTGTYRDLKTEAISAVRTPGARAAGKARPNRNSPLEISLLSRLDRDPDLLEETRTALHTAESEAVYRLALVAEMRDNRTAAHIYRVSAFCGVIARHAGLSREECDLVEQASCLHDLGKIAIPTEILAKPGPLTPAEWEVMKQHTTIGAQLLEGSPLKLLSAAEVIARSHHERWDGSGYPHGLAGESIPLWGRICALADVFDAVTSERPYKPAFTIQAALKIIKEGRGTHFDPELTDRFLECAKEVGAIRRRYSRRPGSASCTIATSPRRSNPRKATAVSH